MAENSRKWSLSTKIFAALIGGICVGILLHYTVPAGFARDTVIVDGIFYVLGQGFIRLMQMLVVPLVFCSLVCGSLAIGDTKTLGQVGIRTVAFYIFTTLIAVCLSLGIAVLIKPGKGISMDSIESAEITLSEPVSFTDTLLNMIPKNPIASMADGDMLPIIIFAVFVGIMAARLGKGVGIVADFFSQFNDIMMEMTMVIMRAAPVAVFCLIARTFAGTGFSALLPLLKYIGAVALALAIQCFIIYQVLLFVFTGLHPVQFIKKFFSVMLFAFTTASSTAAIPYSIGVLEKKMGVSGKISSFTIPLGATINMDGTSIMQGIAVIFVAEAYGITLPPEALLTVVATATLASIGTAGVPSVGIITLSMVLSSVGLPTEGIALIMGIDRIVDMMRTAVNITGDAVCTAIVAHQNGLLNREVFLRSKG